VNAQIHKSCQERRITRLCHFTPSRNLPGIAEGKVGVLATRHLREDERAVFSPTDLERFDGWLGHVCCSIEYPNAWYLARAREKEKLFRDWVILFIEPHYIWKIGTRFCQRNAAADRGMLVREDVGAFNSLFNNDVQGAWGRTRTRTPRMLTCSPTDDQAEVLVEDSIAFRDIIAVGVRDESQAKRETVRLRLAGVGQAAYKFVVSPDLFEPSCVSAIIREGQRPKETVWVNGKSKPTT
jgi:hypothetical protein